MGTDTMKSVEELLRDVYEKTKPEVESFIKNVESMFELRVKKSPESAQTAETDSYSQTVGFDASVFNWDPREVYVIDANDRLVVTGCIPFDDKLSFTKLYNFTTGEFKTQGNRLLKDIASVRRATEEERELLLPLPSIAEALEILRKSITSPLERKAYDVIRAALVRNGGKPESGAEAGDGTQPANPQN